MIIYEPHSLPGDLATPDLVVGKFPHLADDDGWAIAALLPERVRRDPVDGLTLAEAERLVT